MSTGPTLPRITPLPSEEWTEEQRQALEQRLRDGRIYNINRTLLRHWGASRKFDIWAQHVLGDTQTLPPRERELLVLRTGWLCRSEYEWGQHVRIGRKAGLTDVEIARVKLGPEAPGWEPFDALLLRAADELHADAGLTDTTWAGLAKQYSTQQLMDVVFTVGQYHLVSMVLNSFRVQLDEGLEGF